MVYSVVIKSSEGDKILGHGREEEEFFCFKQVIRAGKTVITNIKIVFKVGDDIDKTPKGKGAIFIVVKSETKSSLPNEGALFCVAKGDSVSRWI